MTNDPLRQALADYDALRMAKVARRAKIGPSEKTIQTQILRWLERRGICAWRNNTGAFQTAAGSWVKCGLPGQADITGVLPTGQRLEIEVKSATGKPSPAQKKFRAKIEENKGLYVLARSVKDVELAICQQPTKL